MFIKNGLFMVNLITEKISTKNIVLQNNHNENIYPVKENILSKKIISKTNNDTKKLLPLGLISGGGILIYYGLRKPNAVKFFKNLVENRMFQIEKNIKDFSIFAKKLIDSSFRNTPNLIETYQKNNQLNISSHLNKITRSLEAASTLRAQNFAFETIQTIHSQSLKPGTSDFEKFKGNLEQITRNITPELDNKRNQHTLICKDLTHLPTFKNDNHADIVENAETQLVALASTAASEMSNYQTNKIQNIIKTQAKKMAKAIIESREQISESKNLIIETTFGKIRELLKLPDTFQPTYSHPKTLDNYKQLSTEDLTPKALPESLDKVFTQNVFWEFLKKHNFANISTEKLKDLFYMIPPDANIKDIGIMIDRLRLMNEVEKSTGKNNEKVFKTLISKLEFLSNKLSEFGEKELLQKCGQNFEDISIEKRKAQLYYVNRVSRRLGFSNIVQMDKYYSQNNNEYMNLNIRKYMDIFKENPDIYFV